MKLLEGKVLVLFDCSVRYALGLGQPDGEGMGIGLDSCVMKTKIEGVFLIQTTDLYPICSIMIIRSP